MTPDLQKEFQLLRDEAHKQLKLVAASGSYRCVFSFWAMPSFTPSSRCTIYSPLPLAKSALPFADYSIWRSDIDSEKLRTPIERLKHPKDLTPTIENDVLWLTDDDVMKIEHRIRRISIPLYLGRQTVAGCDGTCFEFQCGEYFSSISLCWWENFPTEWRPFTETIMQVAAELEGRRREKAKSMASGDSGR